jgi:CubicO group peptidase (beta-lactamase class C family)
MVAVTTSLPRCAPDEAGVDPAALDALVAALDGLGAIDSVMVLRGGNVLLERWWRKASAQRKHILYSVTKTFTATAVGLAVADGLLSVDERVIDILADDAPSAASRDPHLEALTVKHLLTMNTGHTYADLSAVDPRRAELGGWAKTILAEPAQHAPGTYFAYNSGASHLLSIIVQRRVGQTMRDYLEPRLLDPLGIRDVRWDADADGVTLGGWGLFARTEDIAKLGLLLLNRGRWGQTQLVPAEWVKEQFTVYSDNSVQGWGPEASAGYGYQVWKCTRGDAWRADGMRGQYVIMWPEHDVVIAMTSNIDGDMYRVLGAVWDALPDDAFGS